jgi:hypothetical protein
MADDPAERKPETDDPDESGLYELADTPDAEPTPNVPPVTGIVPGNLDVGPGIPAAPGQAAPDRRNDRLDPMLDDPADGEADGDGSTMRTGAGGKGAASHFSGDDPEYVNPEIARMRREEQRMARAEEEAAEAARKQKLMLGLIGGGIVVLVVAYLLLF